MDVKLILPTGLASFLPALNDGGTCPNSVSNGSFCEPRERVVWQLGTLAPGAGVTVTTQPIVAGSTASGTVLVFDGRADDSTGQQVAAARTVVVESDPVLELALRPAGEPVPAGGEVPYTLGFGNRSRAVPSADAVLRMPLPSGTAFDSASDGGSLVDGVVEWDLGSLAPGASGSRQLTVQVDQDALAGDIVVAGAEIGDANTPVNRTRAGSVARVAPSPALRLSAEVTPLLAAPGGMFEVDLTVTNRGGVPLFDVAVELILPDGTGAFLPAVNNGGICPNSVSNGSFCEPRERVIWNVGMLAAAASVTVTSRPPVPAAAPPGTIFTFDATATSADGSFIEAAVIAGVGP